MNFLNRLGCLAVLLAAVTFAPASSFLSVTTDEQITQAGGVFRGTVLRNESFIEDGLIQTRTFLRVDETFKGKLPRIIKVVHSGGVVDGIGLQDGFSPQFKVGEERVLFVSRHKNGSLVAMNGVASSLPPDNGLLKHLRSKTTQTADDESDLTDQNGNPGVGSGESTLDGTGASSSATGLLADAFNLSARFITPDRSEPIPYLIDADALPTGMTLAQATNAVISALAAWTNVSSVKFQFAGFQSFGNAASLISATDGKIRIQLHDSYNSISGTNVLGTGGRYYFTNVLANAGWTLGGNVAGNDFHLSTCGFVVLKHTLVEMQNVTTFAEVLCHEIGHVLSLAHSSENANEANNTLKQAMMYFTSHRDGRGATLGTYDAPILRQVHPTTNTPPFTYNRMIDAVSYPSTNTTVAGVNEIEVRAYDLQTTNLTVLLTNANFGVTNGTFSMVPGGNLKYKPKGYFGQTTRSDPAGNSFRDVVYARAVDGTNASPYVSIRVLSFAPDADSDGLPDTWMTNYFGNANPNIGSNHHASDDFDGDGFSNLREFLLGTDPTNKNSNLHFTSTTLSQLQWEAKGYELYELHSSTNLSTWTRRLSPIIPLTSVGSVSNISDLSPKQFFRVIKVP